MRQFCLLMFLSFFLLLSFHFLAAEKKAYAFFTALGFLCAMCVYFFIYGTLTATARIVLRDISLSSPINKMCAVVVVFFLFSFLIATNFTFHIYRDRVVCCLAYRIHVYIIIRNLCSTRLNFSFFLLVDNFDTNTKKQRRETS